MKYKVTYFVDGPHTIIETKIEETPLTKDELLGHVHVISVEEVEEEIKPAKTKKTK